MTLTEIVYCSLSISCQQKKKERCLYDVDNDNDDDDENDDVEDDDGHELQYSAPKNYDKVNENIATIHC